MNVLRDKTRRKTADHLQYYVAYRKLVTPQARKHVHASRRRLLSSGKEGSSAGRKIRKLSSKQHLGKSREKGGSGIGGVLFLASGATLGYGAMKLYKDPEFCATARENVPALVKVVEPYIWRTRLPRSKPIKKKTKFLQPLTRRKSHQCPPSRMLTKKQRIATHPPKTRKRAITLNLQQKAPLLVRKTVGTRRAVETRKIVQADVTSGQDPADDSSSENA